MTWGEYFIGAGALTAVGVAAMPFVFWKQLPKELTDNEGLGFGVAIAALLAGGAVASISQLDSAFVEKCTANAAAAAREHDIATRARQLYEASADFTLRELLAYIKTDAVPERFLQAAASQQK